MPIKKLTIITLFLFSSSATFADTVPLNFNRVFPGFGINVSISHLDKAHNYDVECLISHPNNAKKPAYVFVGTTLILPKYPSGDISFNGVFMRKVILTADLPGDKTLVKIEQVSTMSEGVTIANKTYNDPIKRDNYSADVADIITVTDCKATPSK